MRIRIPGKLLQFTAIAGVFTSPIIAGVIIGHFLDEYFMTEPILTVVLMLAGFAAGLYQMIRMLKLYLKEMSR